MKQKYILEYIRESIDDKYAMEVLYYTLKTAVITNDYNLRDVSYVDVDGRYHGDTIRVGTRMRFRSTLHTISMLLSVRALMLNESYLSCCENDHLIFTSIPKEKFQWIENTTIILDCLEDDEFAMLYSILEDLYFDEELSDEDKEQFEESTSKPEYKNTGLYYRNIASSHQGVEGNVICNNAFVCDEFSNYEVGEEIMYVGNTAFAYCKNLETIKFNGQVSFGKFPIIECEKLRQILVPTQCVKYYREELPYYKDIVNDEEMSVLRESMKPRKIIGNEMIDESEIEIVHVGIPSADPYTDVEIDEEANVLANDYVETIEPIDITKFRSVFDKKATSYKYFWWMAIVTLAKDKGTLVIPFKDIVIRMASIAWPIVLFDDINLGKIDQLPKYLTRIYDISSLSKSLCGAVVDDYLRAHDESQMISKILEPLLKNVPYRFLSPWITFTSNDDVVNKTREDGYTGPYSLFEDHIVLRKSWWEYIQSHVKDVYDFTLQSFIAYAKKFNSDNKLSRLKREGWEF